MRGCAVFRNDDSHRQFGIRVSKILGKCILYIFFMDLPVPIVISVVYYLGSELTPFEYNSNKNI